MPNFDPCLLHIPNKDWSDDTRELDNYKAIERWARRLRDCGCECYVESFAGSAGGGGVPSEAWTQIAVSSSKIGTAPANGVILLAADFLIQADGTGVRVVTVNGNGFTAPARETAEAPGLDLTTPVGIGIYRGSQTLRVFTGWASILTFDPWVYQNSGAPLTVSVDAIAWSLCGCDIGDFA